MHERVKARKKMEARKVRKKIEAHKAREKMKARTTEGHECTQERKVGEQVKHAGT